MVTDSSETMAPSGSSAPMTAAAVSAVRSPPGSAGRSARLGGGRGAGGDRVGQRRQRPGDVVARLGEDVHLAAVGDQGPWQPGVGEERDRGTRPGEDQVTRPLELRGRVFGQVGEPLYGGEAGAAFLPGRERLTEQPCAGGDRDAARRVQGRLAHAGPAEQDGARLTAAQGSRGGPGDLIGDLGRPPRGPRGRGLRAVGPRHVRRQDQRRHPAGRSTGRLDGVNGVGGHVLSAQRPADPHGNRPGDRFDVGLERRVQPLVIGGVVADHREQRRPRAARVVQVRQPVAQAGTEVQQYRRRPAGHPPVAVRGAGRHTLELAQHPPHFRHRVQRGHEMHLRRARVGEAHLHPAPGQRPDKRLRTVHDHTFRLTLRPAQR